MSKKSRNWMPFYIGDYLRDTGRLTTEQHGAYVLLIFDYWISGEPLPDDDEQLAAITKLPAARWKKARPILVRFFQVADGQWHHKRVDKELRKAGAISEERSEAGKTGAEKRWGKDGKSHSKSHSKSDGKSDGKGMASPKQSERQSISQTDAPSPSHSSSLRSEEAAAASARAPVAETVLAMLGHDPSLLNTSRVDTWLRRGFDPDLDIYPAIKAVLAKKPPGWVPNGLDYFDGAIADAKARRTKPMPEGKADDLTIPDFLDRRRPRGGTDAALAGLARSSGGG